VRKVLVEDGRARRFRKCCYRSRRRPQAAGTVLFRVMMQIPKQAVAQLRSKYIKDGKLEPRKRSKNRGR
jgi:hypothetical protein